MNANLIDYDERVRDVRDLKVGNNYEIKVRDSDSGTTRDYSLVKFGFLPNENEIVSSQLYLVPRD